MIAVGEYRGIGPAAVGTNRGLAEPAAMGSCCCSSPTFLSGSMSLTEEPYTGGVPLVNVGYVQLYKYDASGGSAGIEDKTLGVDVTSIQGRNVTQLFYETFTLPLVENGSTVGSMTYQYVSGTPFALGTANWSIVYKGTAYSAKGAFSVVSGQLGLVIQRTNITPE